MVALRYWVLSPRRSARPALSPLMPYADRIMLVGLMLTGFAGKGHADRGHDMLIMLASDMPTGGTLTRGQADRGHSDRLMLAGGLLTVDMLAREIRGHADKGYAYRGSYWQGTC